MCVCMCARFFLLISRIFWRSFVRQAIPLLLTNASLDQLHSTIGIEIRFVLCVWGWDEGVG